MATADTGAAKPGSQAQQLRANIDAGLTGDKVDFPDPAAAPLGTDDEAAGVTSAPAAIAQTTSKETTRPVKPGESGFPIWVMIGAVVLIAVVIAGAFLLY